LVITLPVVAEGALPLQTVKSKFCAVVEVATVIVPVAGAVKLNQTSVLPVVVVKGELKVADKVVPETDPPFTVMEVGAEERSLAGGGTGMLKVEEVEEVRAPEVNVIVAPVTAAALVAVSPENVVTPEEAPTEVVPPIVHVPAPTAAVMEAVLVVTVLPY
jgi:hypothetical protein